MTSSVKRYGSKVPSHFTKEGQSGVRYDSGPYEAVVMNNVDPTRSGRMAVYIPDLGGNPRNEQSWLTVAYASPFFGVTGKHPDEYRQQTTYEAAPHSYGFWFTPPDIGNLVLVTFANGDPNRGYWFACVVPELVHQMVPAVSSSTTVKDPPQGLETAAPTVEFNLSDTTQQGNWSDFTRIPKPIHKAQYQTLLDQGLDRDAVRGAITSSSQRESPSAVFGFSTPGRGSQAKSIGGRGPQHRLGGHTFVLDDGDATGKDQLVRIRTAGGHQLLMNDTEGVMYLGNSAGTVWLEFTAAGNVLLYADQDISIRSRGNLNLHADGNLNMHAGADIRMVAVNSITTQADLITTRAQSSLTQFGGTVGILSGSDLKLTATTAGSFGAADLLTFSADGTIKLNSGAAPKVAAPKAIELTAHADAAKKGTKWEKVADSVQSIVTKLPHHEPYHGTTAARLATAPAQQPTTPPVNAAPAQVSNIPTVIKTKNGPDIITNLAAGESISPSAFDAGEELGINEAPKTPLTLLCPPQRMLEQPAPKSRCGTLTVLQTKALLAQLGFSESTFNYNARNNLNYVGKYQFGAAALEDLGYLKKGTYRSFPGNSGTLIAPNWTGKDGLNSVDDYFASTNAQETIVHSYILLNYSRLLKNKGIFLDDSPEVIAGMLTTAHLLGAAGAKLWRFENVGVDGNRTSGATYFNRGKYAATTLSRVIAA